MLWACFLNCWLMALALFIPAHLGGFSSLVILKTFDAADFFSFIENLGLLGAGGSQGGEEIRYAVHRGLAIDDLLFLGQGEGLAFRETHGAHPYNP